MTEPTDTNLKEMLGARIRLARQLTGMSQRALGARLGITVQQMNKLERGRSNPSFERMMQIAQITGQSLTPFDVTNDTDVPEMAATPASHEIAAILDGLPGRERRAVLKLIRGLAAKHGLTSEPDRGTDQQA